MKSSGPQTDVALISMLFVALNVPSMGLSMLKPGLTASGIRTAFAKAKGYVCRSRLLREGCDL